jgi:hypothetical protein
MGRNPLQTAHRRIPAEGPSQSEASNRSSSAGARLFLFPGTNRLLLTPRTDGSSSSSGTRNGQDPRSRPLNRLFSSSYEGLVSQSPAYRKGMKPPARTHHPMPPHSIRSYSPIRPNVECVRVTVRSRIVFPQRARTTALAWRSRHPFIPIAH